MLQARRRPISRGQQAISRPLPPPVGGWNAKDALDGMKPTDAVILENWFPRESDVVTRGGYSLHCNTGEGAHNVETIAEFKSGATRKMLVGCNGKLINTTTSTPSTVGTGFTNNRWRWVNFGERLIMVNGLDTPQDWDGTTLTSTAWSGSGLTITNLSDVCVFKDRLFFIEKNTLNVWYASLQAITGTLVKFPLKYTGTFGGVLKAMATVTIDGGSGPDDIMLFYLSSGEVIVYQGSDPGVAADWGRVGTFYISPPIAEGTVAQFGSDVVALTHGAYTPITRVMPYGRSSPAQLDLSDKISGAVSQAAEQYSDNTGWQIIFYPFGRKLIFNIPRSASYFDQHVMNVDTKAWCKFTGWNFPVFGLYNDNLYGGGTDGKVYQVDTGFSDNTTAITCDLQTAWNYFGNSGQEKNFTMARVIFGAVSDPEAVMSIGTDFEIAIPTSAVETSDVDGGGQWDTAEWDVSEWAGSEQAIRGWQGITGQGYSASMRLRVSVDAQEVALKSGNIIFKPAGMV